MNQMEEEEGDDEEMGVAETYADYWPAKCKFVEIWFENRKNVKIFKFKDEIPLKFLKMKVKNDR